MLTRTRGCISDERLKQAQKKEEVVYSTTPQKMNRIDFENSEGNAGISAVILEHFARMLQISRFQRCLSTVHGR